MATQEIYDLFAQIEDESTPLITFNLGELTLNVWHPDNLSKGDSIESLKTQLLAQAIAKESTDLSNKYQDLLKGEDLDRSKADEAGEVYSQILQKSMELDLLTVRYLEIITKKEKDTLIPDLESEVENLYRNPPPLERFINQIARAANKAIADYNKTKLGIVDESVEDKTVDIEAETEKNPLESESNTVESSEKNLQSSEVSMGLKERKLSNSKAGSLTA